MDRKAEEEPIAELLATDDNAARRPPATVRQTPVQQAEDPRDMP